MKKIVCSALALMCAVNISGNAEVEISVADYETDRISVCTDAPENSDVMLYILNSGSGKEEFVSGVGDSLIYSSHGVADKNGCRFDVDMRGFAGGDDFKVIVAHSGGNETESFAFYPNDTKIRFIDDLSERSCTTDDIGQAIKIFGIQNKIAYDANSLKKASEAIEEHRIANGFAKKPDGAFDTEEFATVLEKALVVGALMTSNDGIFDSDGKILYAEVLGFDKLGIYFEYKDNLSVKGIESVKKYMQTASYAGKDINSVFSESILINIITNYRMMGYGHVKDYIKKYESEYIKAGFDISKFDKLSDSQKSSVCKIMAESDENTFSALASVFNRAISDISNSSQSSGSGSGSGGGGGFASLGTSVAPGYVEPVTAPVGDDNTADTKFSDVDESHWAYEYIKLMSDKKIINGYDDGRFMPDSGVTRGEFAKMAVSVLGLSVQDGDCAFEDVKNTWSAPFVSAAVRAGLVNGISDKVFAPDMPVSREQAATIIARAVGTVNTNETQLFDDDDQISEYAKDAVYALKALGKINGRGTNSFAPKDGITRAEAVKLLATALEIQP